MQFALLRQLASWSIAGLVALHAAALGQAPCSLAFAPGDALAGVDGAVGICKPWDPDAAGPAPLHVVVAGEFRVAGSVFGPFLAAYEPVARQWVGFGQGLPGPCLAVGTSPNGRLVAYAQSTGVFEWNGTTWQQLGPNFVQGVSTLAIMANGDVVAGGSFQAIGSAPIYGIARWDGATWNAMGAPTVPWSLGRVDSMELLPNGDLVAVGLFTQIGGVACSLIARWDGVAWSPFGAGSTTVPMQLAVTTNGEVVAGGTFATATGTARLVRWNGTAWIDIGAGLPMTFGLLLPLTNGGVLAIGSAGIWAWNGTAWSMYAPGGSGIGCAYAIGNNDLMVGGSFAPTPSVPALNLARWNGTTWQAPNVGNTGIVRTVATLPDGSFFVGGSFLTVGGQVANRLARFDGTTWTPIASTAINAVKFSLARPNGEVVIVGEFPNVQGGMDFVMSWNGAQVVPIYQGLWGARIVNCMALAANGDVLMHYSDLATFSGGIARWNGTTLTFTPVGAISCNALLELPGGDLLLAGFFGGSPSPLMRWNGTQLTPFGSLLSNSVTCLALAPNGDVIVGGGFSVPARVARWDGVAWQPYGAGLTDAVTSLALLPDGDVVACERRSVNSVWNSRVQYWNGTAWTLRGDTAGQANVVWSPTGTLALYGEFTNISGAANAYFARLQPTCPAVVLDRGGGCAGSAGLVALAVTERAWIGGSLQTSASGLPVGALSIGVFGFAAQTQPLSSLHPLGVPGCRLLTTDDILLQFGVVAGAASPRLPIPNAPALVGASFQHQLLAVEVDANGHAAAITSSNALQLTIGSL